MVAVFTVVDEQGRDGARASRARSTAARRSCASDLPTGARRSVHGVCAGGTRLLPATACACRRGSTRDLVGIACATTARARVAFDRRAPFPGRSGLARCSAHSAGAIAWGRSRIADGGRPALGRRAASRAAAPRNPSHCAAEPATADRAARPRRAGRTAPHRARAASTSPLTRDLPALASITSRGHPRRVPGREILGIVNAARMDAREQRPRDRGKPSPHHGASITRADPYIKTPCASVAS